MFARFKKRLQGIICLLIFLSLNKAFAQPKFLQPELDINNGLKSNTIRVIQKCPLDQSIWLGTEDGLTILNNNDSSCKKITSILQHKPVWTLAFYKNNAIIGTRFNGIYFFDLKKHSIVQHLDSNTIGLCRRIKVINDTIFIATPNKTFYATYNLNKWVLHTITTNINDGFITDFASFNNKIYASAYAEINSKLTYFKNDSLFLVDMDKEMKKDYKYCFTLCSSDSLMALGGSYSFSIFKPKNNNEIEQIHTYKWKAIRPIWDAVVIKKNVFLATGNPSDLQEGTIYQYKSASENDINPNFYGQSLYFDNETNGLWCSTINRGLFYWPNITESYKFPIESNNGVDFVPINEDNIILYNQKQLSIYSFNNNLLEKRSNITSINNFNGFIKDVCEKNDSVFVLSNSQLIIYYKQTAVWKISFPLKFFNRIHYNNGKLLLFAQYADRIWDIDIKTKSKIIKYAPTNLTSNKKLNNGLIYFSNYSGFFYFDTVAHSLNLPILNAESFDLLNDTLFFCQGGTISGYKINSNNFSATPIFNKNLKDIMPQFMPRWVISNSGKLYCGNSKGILEINTQSGLPINYIYLGNYNEEKEPKSFGKYFYLNHNNYLTRINPIEENTKINKLDFNVNVMPSNNIDEKNPFTINILSPNFLLQTHSLKRLDIFLDGKLVKQYYSLSDVFNFPGGLTNGKYKVKVYINNTLIQALDVKISIPIMSNPYFYLTIMLIVLLLGFLFFKMILNKRLYQKHILENRLQLLKQNLNPHFIFNSLNLIYSLVLQQKNAVAIKTINQFSDLHRYYLDNINKPKVNLEEELSFIKSYIQLESARVEIDDTLTYFLPENLSNQIKNILVPPMILQPLVENAVKYSYANSIEKRTIWIDVTENSNQLVIGIENTLPENGVDNNSGSGLGIKMVTERIDIFNKSYKESVKIFIDQAPKHTQFGYRCELVFYV